jgi:hypothetical protein
MSTPANRQSRRLARFGGSLCGATDLVLWGARAPALPLTPRTPQRWKQAPRGSGRAEKGAGDSFFLSGGIGSVRKTRGSTPCFSVSPCQSKQNLSTGLFQIPRVVPFSTRVVSFSTRVVFCDFSPRHPSSSSFSLEKERERETDRGVKRIHGFFWRAFLYPRVCYVLNSYSVDVFGIPWTPSLYKSMTCASSPDFPRSTGKNAYTPLKGGSQ